METNDEHQSMDITIFVPSLLWYRVRKGKKKRKYLNFSIYFAWDILIKSWKNTGILDWWKILENIFCLIKNK